MRLWLENTQTASIRLKTLQRQNCGLDTGCGGGDTYTAVRVFGEDKLSLISLPLLLKALSDNLLLLSSLTLVHRISLLFGYTTKK